MIGIASLAVEYGHGLLQRSDNQRAADLAAYGGALVYNSTGGNAATARSAATGIAALNGFTSGNATVTPAIVSSPRGNGNQAMQVTINTNLPMYLAEVLTASTTLPVRATGYAEIEPDAPGCIIALKPGGTGITMQRRHQHHRQQLHRRIERQPAHQPDPERRCRAYHTDR